MEENIIKQRTYFPMYRSFVAQIRMMSLDQQLKWYNIIIDYALDLIDPELSDPTEKIIWMGMKPNLDASLRHYSDGRKGGCPPGTRKPSMDGNKNAFKGNDTNISKKATKQQGRKLDLPKLPKLDI